MIIGVKSHDLAQTAETCCHGSSLFATTSRNGPFLMAGKKTVFIPGNFMVIHPGHLRLFQLARELGDEVIVGIYSDRLVEGRNLVPHATRLESVDSNSLVDRAIIIDEPIEDVITRLRPDIVLKGREHEGEKSVESEAVTSYGGVLVYSSGQTEFSTFDFLRNDYLSGFEFLNRPAKEYLENHVIDEHRLVKYIEQFSTLRVAVIGDLIIDKYVDCRPLGMSREDPTISVSPINSTSFIGGAGIVALHAAGLGAKAILLSVTGEDDLREFAIENLAPHVEYELFPDASRPTTLKERYRASNKTLLRVSHLHQNDISVTLQHSILTRIEEIISDLDLLVFSDFNYGCLPDKLVNEIIALCKKNNVFVSADSQSSSQFGNICRFYGVDLVTPTEHEARIAIHDNQSGLVVLADKIKDAIGAQNVLLKLGVDGVLVYGSDDQSRSVTADGWTTDILEALNHSPKDIIGAGDSMIISSSMAMALGANVWEAALIGSYAAALQVSRIGNIPVNSHQLIDIVQQ